MVVIVELIILYAGHDFLFAFFFSETIEEGDLSELIVMPPPVCKYIRHSSWDYPSVTIEQSAIIWQLSLLLEAKVSSHKKNGLNHSLFSLSIPFYAHTKVDQF